MCSNLQRVCESLNSPEWKVTLKGTFLEIQDFADADGALSRGARRRALSEPGGPDGGADGCAERIWYQESYLSSLHEKLRVWDTKRSDPCVAPLGGPAGQLQTRAAGSLTLPITAEPLEAKLGAGSTMTSMGGEIRAIMAEIRHDVLQAERLSVSQALGHLDSVCPAVELPVSQVTLAVPLAVTHGIGPAFGYTSVAIASNTTSAASDLAATRLPAAYPTSQVLLVTSVQPSAEVPQRRLLPLVRLPSRAAAGRDEDREDSEISFQMEEPRGQVALPAQPPPASGGFSRGSVGHPHLCGRACRFYFLGVCANGNDCGYCHMPHTKRPVHFTKRQRELWKEVPLSNRLSLVAQTLREKIGALGLGPRAVAALHTWRAQMARCDNIDVHVNFVMPECRRGEMRKLRTAMTAASFQTLCGMVHGAADVQAEEQAGLEHAGQGGPRCQHSQTFLSALRAIVASHGNSLGAASSSRRR